MDAELEQQFSSVRSMLVHLDAWLVTVHRIMRQLEAGLYPSQADARLMADACGHSRLLVEKTIAGLDTLDRPALTH